MDELFQALRRHLDSLPAGFPSTPSGVEIRILKRLFTPDEARLALGLTMLPEPPYQIAQRLGLEADELSQQLKRMSEKGLIFRRSKGDQQCYSAAQFVVGIWEYHVKDLDEALIRDVNEYLPHLFKESWGQRKTKQLRVIPVSQSLNSNLNVMPYEVAETIVKQQSKIVVAPCICRTEHKMIGKECDFPIEVCFSFGSGAYYYEQNGLGRSVSQQEALALMRNGVEAGLVLQPGNQKKPMCICMCCGCCCQILKNLKSLPRPAQAVNSNYFAVVEESTCSACGQCQSRCHMEAIEIQETAVVDLDRCIGCGVCVIGCETGALRLDQKDPDEQWIPPATVVETYMNIAKERGNL